MAARRNTALAALATLALTILYLAVPFAYMPGAVQRAPFSPTTADKTFEIAYGWLLGRCAVSNPYTDLVRRYTAKHCSLYPGRCAEPSESAHCGA